MQGLGDCPEDIVDNTYIEIGRNVKRIRMEKGFSQLQLAQSIGHKSVSIVSLAEIYHNKQHFNIEHLAKIAYILDVDICEFFPKKSNS
ncbi:MAG: helix-turn-helix transcriptional regulator [Sulfuricurvum sp.]|uniref:helix-turn-helix domain-containing protein n=1 Tax=Sulfuricurvum sp. TaxID=2025608 RepID=UPI003565D037